MDMRAQQVTWKQNNDKTWDGVVFASDLGLKPGEWPKTLFVLGKVVHKKFTYSHKDDTGYHYKVDSFKISILND